MSGNKTHTYIYMKDIWKDMVEKVKRGDKHGSETEIWTEVDGFKIGLLIFMKKCSFTH